MRARLSEQTGTAIRKLRLSRGWSLSTLSEHTGVPISTLSRVELGRNALNYEKLMRLCRAFEIDLEGLVAREAEAAPTPSGRRAVVRAGEGVRAHTGGNIGRRAAADVLSKSFSPIVIDVTARDLGSHGPFVGHPGEAYLFVVAGDVAFHSRLYAPLEMAEGDAVYFDASVGYAVTSPQPPAKVLLVASGETAFGV